MTGRREAIDRQGAIGRVNGGIVGKPFAGQAFPAAIMRSPRPRTEEEDQMTKHMSKSTLRHHQVQPATSLDATRPLVLVVDDDAAIRESLCELLESVGIDAMCFASTREFNDAALPDRPGCLILDVRLPGASGLELQGQLASRGNMKPVIFLTGHGDIEMTVRAMRAGAIDFLTKPFRPQALLDAINAAIEKDVSLRAQAQVVKGHTERLATLTPREREVLSCVAHGRLNKQIAYDLGISEVTVKLHRSNAKRKMQATSARDLVRAWEAVPPALREQRQPGHGNGALETGWSERAAGFQGAAAAV